MKLQNRVAAILATIATLAITPAQAMEAGQAEKLRRLDIMLMVTGLRCRHTEDNFQPDFEAFEARHLNELNTAASQMRVNLIARFGVIGAARELDRLSTTMANQYGGGHPWLGCHELAMVTRDLAAAEGAPPLFAAADELLQGDAPRLAYAGN